MVNSQHRNLLIRAYQAFNARDLDEILTVMHPDVDWANGMEGGYVHGREALRAYWISQWNVIDPQVDPEAFQAGENGQIVIDVHQVVRDLAGNRILDQRVHHIYTFQEDLIRRMDIGESPRPFSRD